MYDIDTYKLKSNEEITKAFDKEEITKKKKIKNQSELLTMIKNNRFMIKKHKPCINVTRLFSSLK